MKENVATKDRGNKRPNGNRSKINLAPGKLKPIDRFEAHAENLFSYIHRKYF